MAEGADIDVLANNCSVRPEHQVPSCWDWAGLAARAASAECRLCAPRCGSPFSCSAACHMSRLDMHTGAAAARRPGSARR